MKWLCRSFLSACLTFSLLGAFAGPAEAALTRYIRVTGTSSGPGVCSIIIESFGLLKGGGMQTAAPQAFNINVNIPASSSAANTAALIRNDVDAALPADYLVTVVPSQNHVRIERTDGTFTMSLSENVPGQEIAEHVAKAPALGAREMVALLVLLSLAGAFVLGKQRRRTA